MENELELELSLVDLGVKSIVGCKLIRKGSSMESLEENIKFFTLRCRQLFGIEFYVNSLSVIFSIKTTLANFSSSLPFVFNF